MNFRTTIVLFVLLIAAAVALFVVKNRDDSNPEPRTDESTGPGKKLLDLTPANVNKVTVTSDRGMRIAFERAGTAEWRLTDPVKAPADAFKVDDLVREVTDLRTTGRSDPAGKGLDNPAYVIELADKDNKTTKVNVGSRSPVGDILYVRVEGQDQADLVSTTIIEQLDKPASEYRKNRLLAVSNDKITGVTVTTEDGKTLKLAKKPGESWEILEPKKMPGDSGQIGSLLTAITGLDAVKFVAEDAKDAARYGLGAPKMTVSFTTTPPTTQPSTQPAPSPSDATTIKFGRSADIMEKHIYAIASDSGPVVTVLATSMDGFKKTPLELRERKLLDIEANSVSKMSISIDTPATTQPTTQPASKRQVVLERRSEIAATTQAATKPTTSPSTGPTTKPAELVQTKWLLASDPKGDADDTKVTTLLQAIHPLQVDKYLESLPTTQAAPAASYTLKISTRPWGDEPAREHEIKITDPGKEAKLIGQLGELTFEFDRAIIETLTADYAKATVAPAGPELPGALPPSPIEFPPVPGAE